MARTSTQHHIVSDDSELLQLVDSADTPLGVLDKASCHDGAGVLHRAFSLFVFNDDGAVLLQQRHAGKRLWPGYWSNSCCSHPRAGEAMDEAVVRRSEQELGIPTVPRFLYKFEYAARYDDSGGEHELCWVYVAHTHRQPHVNTTEIEDWTWITPAALDDALRGGAKRFTPWLQLEWRRLRSEFRAELPASAAGRRPHSEPTGKRA